MLVQVWCWRKRPLVPLVFVPYQIRSKRTLEPALERTLAPVSVWCFCGRATNSKVQWKTWTGPQV